MVLREAEANTPRVVRQRRSVMAPPPPPPPPPMRVTQRPVVNNARARLMAELKANPKFRNLRVN
jgi:hypothetical protein